MPRALAWNLELASGLLTQRAVPEEYPEYLGETKGEKEPPHARRHNSLELKSAQAQMGFKIPKAVFNLHALAIQGHNLSGRQERLHAHRDQQIPS